MALIEQKYDDKNPVGDNEAARDRRLQDENGYTICDHCGGPIELFIDMRREFEGRLYWAHIGNIPDHLARPKSEVK